MVSLNCHITSGFSGLPKVEAIRGGDGTRAARGHVAGGFGDGVHRADAGIQLAPAPLPSVESARARFPAPVCGSLMRTTAASLAPGRRACWCVRWCRTARDPTFGGDGGDDSSFTKFAVRFVPSAAKANQSAAVSFLDAGAAMGRL